MYNQEIKERFFAASSQNESKRRYLEQLSSGEESAGIDVCQMTRAQAIEAIRVSGGYDLSTFNNLVSCSKAYAKWCYNNGIYPESPYGIMGVSPSDINPEECIREYIFKSEESLIEVMSRYTQIYDGYVEVIACIFAWLGIDDPLSIHDSDVFIEGRKIIRNGSVVVDGFSDFVCDFLSRYKTLKSSTRDNGTTTYVVIKDRSHDTFIKRFCPPTSPKLGKKLDLRVIQSAMYEMNNKYVIDGGKPIITYRNIMKSGSLSRLYKAEQSGLQVFDKANKDIVEGLFYRSDYRSIVWLYKHYKVAFNL